MSKIGRTAHLNWLRVGATQVRTQCVKIAKKKNEKLKLVGRYFRLFLTCVTFLSSFLFYDD